MAYRRNKTSLADRFMKDREKTNSSSLNNVLKRHEQEKQDIEFFEKMIPVLDEKYEDYFSGKISKEPRNFRRQMEDIIVKYRKSPFVRTMYKFKFGTLVSKYNTYKVKWDAKLREMERKELTVSPADSVSEVEKKYLNKIIDNY